MASEPPTEGQTGAAARSFPGHTCPGKRRRKGEQRQSNLRKAPDPDNKAHKRDAPGRAGEQERQECAGCQNCQAQSLAPF